MDIVHHERRIQTVCLLILTSIAIGAALYWLRPVMLPFVLAVFITLALTALIDLIMHYFRAPRPVALVLTLALGLLAAAAAWVLVSDSVAQLARSANAYQTQFQQLFDRFIEFMPLDRLGLDTEETIEPLSLLPATTIRGMLVGTTNAITDLLSQGLLVLVFVLFLLLGKQANEARSTGMRHDAEAKVKRYLGTKMLTSGVTGVLVGVVLWLLGIDLAPVFGLFAFLLNFIPSLGSVIATLLPLPVVIVNPEVSMLTAALAIAIPGGIQFTVGNLIEPRMMGHSLDLHPVVVLMALVLWGMIWGVVGMILAAPITAVMKIMLERMPITAPVADLLAGRLPAGAPSEPRSK